MSTDDLGSVKGAYPFRVGVTSRCGAAPVVATVEAWRWKVDDVLVHLESGEVLPGEAEIARARALAEEALLSFTAQLPDDLALAAEDDARREESVERAATAVRRLAPLGPRCFILRLDPPPAGGADAAWEERVARSLARISERTGVAAGFFAVENGAYDFAIAARVLSRLGLSACSDIGLLYGYERDVAAHLAAHLFRSRAVHLHMARDGRLHLPASEMPVDHLHGLLSFLLERHFQSVLTLEVLTEEDFDSSIKALARARDWVRKER